MPSKYFVTKAQKVMCSVCVTLVPSHSDDMYTLTYLRTYGLHECIYGMYILCFQVKEKMCFMGLKMEG